jgi:hypothetical protein
MLLAVIAYLTSDTTLRVVEEHKKTLKVQFQQLPPMLVSEQEGCRGCKDACSCKIQSVLTLLGLTITTTRTRNANSFLAFP